jgi:hypothetical protein
LFLWLQNFHLCYIATKRPQFSAQLKMLHAAAANNPVHYFQLLLEGQQAFCEVFVPYSTYDGSIISGI